MKVAVFAVEDRLSQLGWGRKPIPPKFRSDFRFPLFCELIKNVQGEGVDLAVLPGGFFRADYPAGIAKKLKHYPPKITVLVGRDNAIGNQLEVWVIARNGSITRRIPEAWIYNKNKSKRRAILNSITDRRFQLNNKMYAIFCCGDVIIDNEQYAGRKPPIFGSKAAFVLSHYRASGRSFTPSMRRLGIPVFLSHHVRDPYNTSSFAYNGKYKKDVPKQIRKPLYGKSLGLKWIARFYSV